MTPSAVSVTLNSALSSSEAYAVTFAAAVELFSTGASNGIAEFVVAVRLSDPAWESRVTFVTEVELASAVKEYAVTFVVELFSLAAASNCVAEFAVALRLADSAEAS